MAGFTVRDDEIIGLATAKLIIKKGWVTAFLFSNQNYIITVGHCFSDLGSNIGDLFQVQFLYYKTINARLIEYLWDESDGIDYAILELTEDIIPNRIPIKISDSWGKHIGKNFLLRGFPESISSLQTSINGKIDGRAFLLSKKAYYIQLSVDPNKITGMSGAAICVNDDSVSSIGIQSQQGINHSHKCFAIPFGRLIGKSDIIKDHCVSNKYSKVIKNLFIDNDAFPERSTITDTRTRWVLFLVPFEVDNKFSNEIYEKIALRWSTFFTNGITQLEKLNWLKIKKSYFTIDKYHINTSKDKSLADFFNNREIAHSLQLFRVIVDLDGSIISKNREINFDSFQISHCIGIKKEGVELNITSDENFNVIYNLNYNTADKNAHAIMNLIEDIYIDIIIFNSIPVLNQLFNSVETKKVFSEIKVEFIKKNGLKIYGEESISKINGYISFASCCRNDVFGQINYTQFIQLWTYFIYEYLFESLIARKSNRTPTSNLVDVINQIKGLKLIAGQVSEKRLHQLLSNKNIDKGELLIFAIARKRPKVIKTQTTLASIFGYSKWKSNMNNFFKIKELQPLVKYSTYLKFYFFRLN